MSTPDPQRLLDAHAAANDFYRSHLLDEPRALTYLRSRGIVAATAHAAPWTIGWAPVGWTVLRDHLRRSGFTDPELLAAGLVTTARNGNLIDVFRARVTFPVRDRQGQVVAFTGRDLTGRTGTPKYRNTTTTAIYQKKTVLYGLAEQLDPAAPPAAIMLVEGPADVMAVARLRQSLPTTAYPQPYLAVAPCGTALTAEQIRVLAAAVPAGTPLVVAFDADHAGQAAIDRAYELLRDWPGPVEAMGLPDGDDPASLVAAGPAEAVAAFARARVPLAELVLRHRLAPHQQRLNTRVAELERLGRDPGLESTMMRLDAIHAVAPLITEAAAADPHQAAHLAMTAATELQVDPLRVFEVVYPPAETDAEAGLGPPSSDPPPASPGDPGPAAADGPPARAMPGAGFPHPDTVGHAYARTGSPQTAAALWVEHDPRTEHTAWVLAEPVTDSPAGRAAAALAAEVAGRVAVVVGAEQAVGIARTALNAHFAGHHEQGDASIAVLTSFDGQQPRQGQGRFSVAWAGDTRAYAGTARWFAPLTVDHTSHAHRGPAAQARDAFLATLHTLTTSAESRTGPQDRALAAAATRPAWLDRADGADLARAWHALHRQAPTAAAAAAIERRVTQLYPDLAATYAATVAAGAAPSVAIRTAATAHAGLTPRPGDGLLTSSVRHGPVGVNRIDLPVTQILLAGRALNGLPAATIRDALHDRDPQQAVDRLGRLAGGTAALAVRPRAREMTAAHLAGQDQAAGVTHGPQPLPAPARRAALLAAPHTARATR